MRERREGAGEPQVNMWVVVVVKLARELMSKNNNNNKKKESERVKIPPALKIRCKVGLGWTTPSTSTHICVMLEGTICSERSGC